MNVEKAEVFLKTLEIGSMKKAAKKLGYTQSGLHYIINSLEEELGFQVLSRTTKGIFLNERGKTLLPYLKRLVEANDDLVQRANEMAQKSPFIRIGVIPCMSVGILPDILQTFMRKMSGIKVEVVVAFKDLVSALELGEIDVAILPRYAAKDYLYHHLTSTYFCAAMPADWVEEEISSITVEEFRNYPVIVTTTNPENMVFSALAQYNTPYTIRCSVLGTAEIFSMVGRELGVTYLSALYQPQCPPDVRMIPFKPDYSYDIGIIVRPSDEHKLIIRTFISIAQACCENVESSQ